MNGSSGSTELLRVCVTHPSSSPLPSRPRPFGGDNPKGLEEFEDRAPCHGKLFGEGGQADAVNSGGGLYGSNGRLQGRVCRVCRQWRTLLQASRAARAHEGAIEPEGLLWIIGTEETQLLSLLAHHPTIPPETALEHFHALKKRNGRRLRFR